MNVDGAFSRVKKKCACGGLIRDTSGRFLKGFIHPIEDGDELTAEIWGCLLGLKTAWAMGFKRVWMETDSTKCLELLSREHSSIHRDSAILSEVKKLIQMAWETNITYVSRPCNSAADYLAKKGLGLGWGLHELYLPPKDLQSLLVQDCNGGNIPIGV